MTTKGVVKEHLIQILSVTYTGRHFEEGVALKNSSLGTAKNQEEAGAAGR